MLWRWVMEFRKHRAETMCVRCWTNVGDVDPTSNKHWLSISLHRQIVACHLTWGFRHLDGVSCPQRWWRHRGGGGGATPHATQNALQLPEPSVDQPIKSRARPHNSRSICGSIPGRDAEQHLCGRPRRPLWRATVPWRGASAFKGLPFNPGN